MIAYLRGSFLARRTIYGAHGSEGGIVVRKPPPGDAIVALHSSGRKIQIIGAARRLKYWFSVSDLLYQKGLKEEGATVFILTFVVRIGDAAVTEARSA